MSAIPEPYVEPIFVNDKPKDALLRFVSKRHAVRYAFSRQPEGMLRLLPHTLLTADKRLCFVKNSKAGCTGIANLLYQYDHGKAAQGDVHAVDRAYLATFPQDSFSFTTVRHPERRLVSAFYDVFVTQTNQCYHFHKDHIAALGFEKKGDLSYKFDVFLTFVAALHAYSLMGCDRHFRPQYMNVGHGFVTLNDIAKLETLDADLARIAARAGVTLPRISKLSSHRKNASGSGVFTPNLAQKAKIATLFAQDYALYDYQP